MRKRRPAGGARQAPALREGIIDVASHACVSVRPALAPPCRWERMACEIKDQLAVAHHISFSLWVGSLIVVCCSHTFTFCTAWTSTQLMFCVQCKQVSAEKISKFIWIVYWRLAARAWETSTGHRLRKCNTQVHLYQTLSWTVSSPFGIYVLTKT